MTDIRELQQKIGNLYRAIEEPNINVPVAAHVMQWISFAEDYIRAATIVDRDGSQHWLPRLQLTGQAVESALKACLAAAHAGPPKHHNLVGLYEKAARHGFTLCESDLAALVHLAHFYYRDLATDTQYKVRYPARKMERLGGAVPNNCTFVSIVRSLSEQATERNQQNMPQ